VTFMVILFEFEEGKLKYIVQIKDNVKYSNIITIHYQIQICRILSTAHSNQTDAGPNKNTRSFSKVNSHLS
jgi:hypothetical protein